MTATAPSEEVRRRSIRRMLLVGVALAVPRFVLAVFLLPPSMDLLSIVTTLMLVAGLFVIGSALIRRQLLRRRRLLWLGLAGVAAVLIAAAVIQALPPGGDAVAYDGGLLTPLPVLLYQYFYLLVGSLSQFGLLLAVGSLATAVARRLSSR